MATPTALILYVFFPLYFIFGHILRCWCVRGIKWARREREKGRENTKNKQQSFNFIRFNSWTWSPYSIFVYSFYIFSSVSADARIYLSLWKCQATPENMRQIVKWFSVAFIWAIPRWSWFNLEKRENTFRLKYSPFWSDCRVSVPIKEFFIYS